MNIRISVTETRYGYIDLDVPSDSIILDEQKTSLQKRRAAQALGKEAIAKDSSAIVWANEEDGQMLSRLYVELGYMTLED